MSDNIKTVKVNLEDHHISQIVEGFDTLFEDVGDDKDEKEKLREKLAPTIESMSVVSMDSRRSKQKSPHWAWASGILVAAASVFLVVFTKNPSGDGLIPKGQFESTLEVRLGFSSPGGLIQQSLGANGTKTLVFQKGEQILFMGSSESAGYLHIIFRPKDESKYFINLAVSDESSAPLLGIDGQAFILDTANLDDSGDFIALFTQKALDSPPSFEQASNYSKEPGMVKWFQNYRYSLKN